MAAASQSPIRIVGAGIGGLTLGRCLVKHGLPVVLYERMPAAARHNYGITLHASSYRPLLDVLGLDEWTFRRRIAVDGLVGGSGNIDPQSLAYSGRVESSSFRANRESFEELLREGLDVQWEQALEKVDFSPSGSLTLHMKTGQQLDDSAIVIGVDGPHSNTRKSLSPETPFDILPYVAFNGKRWVKRDLFDSVYASAFKNTSVVELKKDEALLNISINDTQADKVSISWIYSRPAKGSTDPLHKPNRPVSGATDIPDEFFDEVEGLGELDQPFKEVFDADKLRFERVLHWLMRTVLVPQPELEALAGKGAFFMGDSVHAEPILGGEGANNAIADGVELAERIAVLGKSGIVAWYQSRYADWRDGVRKSHGRIAAMHGKSKASI